jgi:hypothetical protein
MVLEEPTVAAVAWINVQNVYPARDTCGDCD